VQAHVSGKSLVDSLEGTMVWEYHLMACPQKIVKLYRGLMKIYRNQMNIYQRSTTVVEHKDKNQAAGLKIAESFILWGAWPTRLTSRASEYSSLVMTE
jgi:hypothetical protein